MTLNILCAAIALWNTVCVERAVEELRSIPYAPNHSNPYYAPIRGVRFRSEVLH